jgi:hypothetical protein
MSPPADDRTPDAALTRALVVLAPVVRLLMRSGVDHTRLASALKRVFIDEAFRELDRRGQKPTHTAVSLLTGLQRKDVRRLLEAGPGEPVGKAAVPTLPMQVVARWAADPRYTDDEGTPRRLPLRSTDPDVASFESLTRGISKDIHAPAMLDELARLGLAQLEGDAVRLLSEAFVPSREFSQLLDALARNGRDHLSAAVANVLDEHPRFLEYSLVADELRPESVEALHALARRQWRSSYKKAVMAASERIEHDRGLGFGDVPEMRLRYGVYFYAEPVVRVTAGTSPAPMPNAEGSPADGASDVDRPSGAGPVGPESPA